MSYLVLARKYRPRTFADVMGQTPVVRALANALDQQRLHHAYLFTGTRGVGKTTLARILAACFNCDAGVTSTPCGTCGACAGIAAGRFLDLIEVDAASRTGVDDTRELLEGAQFLPGEGRYKVYLIDEVHMLTGHSFNALLKTLEEPPEHVKFLLATTEAKKIPVTVLSRCLQFHLKNMLPEVIEKQLAKVLAAESIDAEPAALAAIARAAGGSMRDALSITDQATSHGGGSVTAASVSDMLGIAGRDEVGALLDALAAKDSARLLAAGDDLAGRSLDLAAVLGELQRAFHDLALATELGVSPEPPYERFQSAFGTEDLQLYYQIALMGGRDIEFAPDAKVGFDMTLIRLASFEPAAERRSKPAQPSPAGAPGQASGRPTEASREQAPRPPPATSGSPPADTDQTMAQPRQPVPLAATPTTAVPAPTTVPAPTNASARTTAPAPTTASAPTTAPAGAEAVPNWHEIVRQMAPEAVTAMILTNANLLRRTSKAWKLLLDPQHETLLNDKQRAEITTKAADVEGAPVRVDFQFGPRVAETPAERKTRLTAEALAKAKAVLGADAVAQTLISDFDARLESAQLVASGS